MKVVNATGVAPVVERLASLRAALRQHGLDGVLIPSSDPHLSEYLPAHWQGREWFSGFTGSMGTLVVTATEAALFADSRYWVQAETELAGSGIDLVKVATAAPVHHMDWIVAHLSPGQCLGVDGHCLGLAAAQALRTRCTAAGLTLRTNLDPLASAWPERPPLPQAPVRALPLAQATVSRPEKLVALRQQLAQHGATHHLVSTVDDIAWLTNLRGADVDYNPVFLSHLLIGPAAATLFIAPGKIAPALADRLAADGFTLADYTEAATTLAQLPPDAVLLLDPRRVTLGLREAVPAAVRVVEAINPSVFSKSRKTPEQAALLRRAMIEDGVAMCAFYARFEAALARGEALTELTVDDWMTQERARRPGFQGLSFPTIAGFNANGAMPHYRALLTAHAALAGSGLLLIDSGAHYQADGVCGTTDITRVWAIGEVSDAQRRDCTRVLQGTLALSRAQFPQGTLAPMLDALARAPLWAAGLDYGHGTGHGVGYFLNVHEGPQSISKTQPEAHMAMQPGMVTSIEPGLYRPGQWGVRIENLVLTVPAPVHEAGDEFGTFLGFETLTLCPIDTRCLDLALLQPVERAWLNAYHATVRERLAPHLEGAGLAWLVARTEAV